MKDFNEFKSVMESYVEMKNEENSQDFEESINERKGNQYLVTVKQGSRVLKQQILSSEGTRQMLMKAFTQTRDADSATIQVPKMMRDLDSGKKTAVGLELGDRSMVIQLAKN